jgi:hypothetical protein
MKCTSNVIDMWYHVTWLCYHRHVISYIITLYHITCYTISYVDDIIYTFHIWNVTMISVFSRTDKLRGWLFLSCFRFCRDKAGVRGKDPLRWNLMLLPPLDLEKVTTILMFIISVYQVDAKTHQAKHRTQPCKGKQPTCSQALVVCHQTSVACIVNNIVHFLSIM